ncbi:MAG: DUF1828 domain-containing protein [Parolsenella sp.]|uniref:DUF1828 domain-containing protein n=1 Tax=Parolsenella sp. TaxID=2083006 RepID=UPI002E792BCE|nr:DUF1828 domain-containing protein [Parolsenella sp.]MEE1372994.1 DUF1828 domain-containing protein [Parolsenella sp.]
MRVEDAGAIIDSYADFIRANMIPTQQGEGVCIATPMLNRNNDCMNVYVGESDSGGLVFTDLGETIGDLELSGFSLTDQRTEKLESILAGFGVDRSDGELFVRASQNEAAVRLNMLLQAMASVDDMYLLSRGSVRNLFAEDIGSWMMDNDISCVPGPSFNGRSGMPYKFDYAIGQNKRHPMRLIKAVNNPCRSGIQNALFGWEDVKASRTDCEGYVFLNSHNTRDGMVPRESVEACQNYGLKPVIWGQNEADFIADLAA